MYTASSPHGEPHKIRSRRLRRYGQAALAPARAVAELIAAIFSPGLDGAATLTSIDISNGGQHRY